MTTPCSLALLESALAGNLPAEDETALHKHLEECQPCGAALERMAGGPAWCQEAAALLAEDDLDAALPAHSIAGRAEWSEVDFTVEHLEPADEPGVLGRLGGYDVLEIIGRGGMGVVLKAFDPELKRCVAIKVLSPHLAASSLARNRFEREARAIAAVVHANVLAIHQVQAAGRLPFLVMPLVAGESLAQRLTAQGRLELKEILRIGMQAAAGLSAAHEQGLVHRDVKPANILLEKGVERAVLTDFGLARAADDVSMTRWGIIAGTPQYMSPEQARGEALDCRSDLFSLGCVLYEMATGVSPFRTDSTLATLRRLIDDAPQSMLALNPELPPWFVGIVDRLLEKDPSKRFASAKEVSELLEDCLAHLQQPASVPLPKVAGTLRVPSAPNSPLLPGEGQGVRAAPGSLWSRKRLLKGTVLMLSLLGISLFVVGVATTNPPDISGQWQGQDWGQVVLKQTAPGQYVGSYTDTVGKGPGRIELKWSRIERRFNGTWSESEDRFGDLSVRLADNEIRGALTTDPRSKINPATPRLAPFVWTRAAPLAGGRESKSGAVKKAPAEAKNSGFFFVTYPVGDLVFQPAAVVDVPAPPPSGLGSPLPPPTAPSAAGVPAPPNGPGAVVQLPSDKADFDSITELIFTTIAPESWLQKGGKGTISHHVANLTISIFQTQKVHEEIVDLLEQLRRMHDIQVVLKTRFIELDARYAARLNLNGELAGLDPRRTAELLKNVEDDRYTWQAPMMTLFDGQAARYSNHFHGASPEHFQVQATVDENRTMVKLRLTTDGYSKEKPTTVRVKDGETAFVNITFQNDRANNVKSPASGKKVVIMMITPRIVVQVEEEDRIDVPFPRSENLDVARARYSAAKAKAEDDVEIRYAIAAAKVSKADYEYNKEANEQVPGSVPQAKLNELLLKCNEAELAVEKAKSRQRTDAKRADIGKAVLEAAQATAAQRNGKEKAPLPPAASALAAVSVLPAAPRSPVADTAEHFVDFMSHGDFDKAAAYFDEKNKKATPPAALKQLWNAFAPDCGKFMGRGPSRADNGYVFVPTYREHANYDYRLTFDKKGRISDWCLVAGAGQPPQAVPASENILKNSGVENGGEKPDNWEQGAETDGVRYSWCKSVAFEGKASLCIEKTAQRYFPIFQWLQTVDRRGDRPALRVSAQVKAEKLTKAVVDVLFLDEQNNWVSHKWAVYIGSKADGDPPANHDWQLYCGTVQIPKEAKKLCIGLQVYGPGKVWFDDIRAGYADDAKAPTKNVLGTVSESDNSQAERINKALDAYDIAMAHFRNGRAAEDEPDAALIALLEARLQAAKTKADRIELLRKLVDMRGKYEHVIELQYKLGRGLRSEADWIKAKTARLDAESRLAKEEANNAVGTNNVENRSDSADPRASAEAAAAFERGQAHQQNKQYADAAADYSKALEFDPKDFAARFNRALAYESLREYDKAIADYTRVLEGDTDFSRNVDSKDKCLAVTHHYRGRAYQWYKHDNAKAVADFTAALRLDPEIEMVHYRRGRAYNALKEYAKAAADFTVALEHDPDYPNLQCAYAWQLATCPDAKFRDGKKALELARKANETFKWEVADQVETLAAACAETGQFEEAVKWQKKAIELFAAKAKAHPEDDKAMRQRLEQYEARKPYRAE